MKLVERLGGLGVEIDVAREIQFRHLVDILNDNGVGMCLTHESQYLGVTFLAENNYLWSILTSHFTLFTPRLVILFLDAFLELQHHRTSGINDFYVVATSQLVGLRGFAMSPQQHLHIMQLAKVVVIDGDESHSTQALTLHTIVYDVAQTVKPVSLGQFLFCFLDGCGHSKTETTAVVDFNL